MKKIKAHIYIESSFPGVSVGAICLPMGTVLIDSPLRPEDSQAWLASLKKIGAKYPMILINLDSHPDRSLGAQELHSPLLTHLEAAGESRQRAAIFKSLKQESGGEWENLDSLNSLRWLKPQILYSKESEIKFGEKQIILREAFGPSPGASWLEYPAAKILFLGDAVTKNQPPFIADANIDEWLSNLDKLLSKEYKDYRLFSGRGGEVEHNDVRETRRFLIDVEKRLERLAKRNAPQSDAGKLAEKLFDKYKYPDKDMSLYIQRLRHGLQAYYVAKYFPALKNSY